MVAMFEVEFCGKFGGWGDPYCRNSIFHFHVPRGRSIGITFSCSLPSILILSFFLLPLLRLLHLLFLLFFLLLSYLLFLLLLHLFFLFLLLPTRQWKFIWWKPICGFSISAPSGPACLSKIRVLSWAMLSVYKDGQSSG